MYRTIQSSSPARSTRRGLPGMKIIYLPIHFESLLAPFHLSTGTQRTLNCVWTKYVAVIKSSIHTGGERHRVRGRGQVTDRPSRRRSLCDSNIYIDFFLGNKESPLVGLELECSGATWPGRGRIVCGCSSFCPGNQAATTQQ